MDFKNNAESHSIKLPVDYIEFKNFVVNDQNKDIQVKEDFDQIYTNETEKLKF
jgi:hypothetical protein